MDLGTRIKQTLNSPESTVAAHGEVDNNTPGAYPETPNEASSDNTTDPTFATSKHSKLHKRDDPRGWQQTDQGAGAKDFGHKHTDSGVGLTEEHETSPVRRPEASIPETSMPGTTKTYGQQEPLTSETGTRTDDTFRNTGALAGGGAVPLAMRQAGDQQSTQPIESSTSTTTTAGAPLFSERQADKGAREPTEVTQEHPYWGNLPQGAGVYNSVTGHGSEEDQKKRQQEIYEQETRGLSGQHPSTVRGLSDFSKSHSQESPLQDTHRSDEQRDSRNKEAMMGAGGAATATAAAATAYKKHESDRRAEDERARETSDLAETRYDERPSEEKKERRRSFGLFRRSSKAEDDHKDKVKEEKVKEEKVKEEKTDEHKKHRFGGLFHRGSDDKREDAATREQRDVDPEDSNAGKYAAYGAAGAGAGGAAAYIANRNRKDDDAQGRLRDETTTAPGQEYQSGSHVRDTKHPQTSQAFDSRTEPRYDQTETRDSHHKTDAATTAGAAGLGAGALASRDRESKRTDDNLTTSSETRDPHLYSAAQTGPVGTHQSTTTTTGDNLSRGTGSALGTSSATQGITTGEPPAIAGHANHGEYNVLSSGTPSGVRIGDSHDTTQRSTQPTIPETSTTRDSHDKSKLAAAGLGATGLGAAGTAAYKSRDDERAQLDKLEPREEQQVRQFERDEAKTRESKPVPFVAGGTSGIQRMDKVIHKCHKCGEDNDISSYFSTSSGSQGRH